MKRKILEITEIDCGDETCDGCRFRWDLGMAPDACDRFGSPLDEKDDKAKRLPECLEAERLMKLADDAVALQNIRAGDFTEVTGWKGNFTVIDDTTTKKAQGPPDSIGE